MFLTISLVIQALVIIMTLYVFIVISRQPKLELGILTKYYVMRQRYERLRLSLLFIVALTLTQSIGIVYVMQNPQSTITPLQIMMSNVVLVALVIFLTTIYRSKDKLSFDEEVGAQTTGKKK